MSEGGANSVILAEAHKLCSWQSKSKVMLVEKCHLDEAKYRYVAYAATMLDLL
ncbi:hypothetical protein DF22_001625 [Xylella fastidiosa]|nr:hypothetical protein M233_07080 [Xylella fastidiosa subsp. multiplex Griffin-1]KFA41808.1 hypothetical protein DF22_001625 [Xylella fastidiosa]MDS9989281.1 hypothetical protein [Xylella fastidiosa]